MLTNHVALVSESSCLDHKWLQEVGAALQVQVTRDLGPIWGTRGTVDVFDDLEHVPVGYWPIVVRDAGRGAGGIHLDARGQPFALIDMGDSWSLPASHCCLEMLTNPFGNRLVPGHPPIPENGPVEFLLEICGPSADARYAYQINGVLVSDFHTPAFFQPDSVGEMRFSFCRAIERPRQVLPGGRLAWYDPLSDRWNQLTFWGQQPKVQEIGGRPIGQSESLRTWVSQQTPERNLLSQLGDELPVMTLVRAARDLACAASRNQAARLHDHMSRLGSYGTTPAASGVTFAADSTRS